MRHLQLLHHALCMLLAWACGLVGAHETLVWHDHAFVAPDARAYAAAAADAVNHTMYMAGGFSHAYQACTVDFWMLDLGTRTWQPQGSSGGRLPTNRGLMGHTLTLFYGNDECSVSGCLLLIGGTHLCAKLGQTQPSAAIDWNTAVWMFKLGSQSAWVSIPVQPALPPMAFHTATVLSSSPGSVIITGGLSAEYAALPSAIRLSWDTASGSFINTPLPNMPVALFGHSAVPASPDAMHVVGGLTAWPSKGSLLEDAIPAAVLKISNKHISFSLAAASWILDSLEAPEKLASAFQIAWLADGTLYTFGGIRHQPSPLTALSAYDTTQGVWLAEEIMINQTSRMIIQNGYNYGPPMVVGAAGIDTASQALPPAIQPGHPLYPLTTRATTSVLIFGGWQLPPAVRELKLASWACVDDEMTWGWSVADAWSLLAHGGPSRRVDATTTTVFIKTSNGDAVPKLLMYGGRVPGSIPTGKSSFTLKYQPSLNDNGGPTLFRLSDWATSYWYSDWWLLDAASAVPPIKLRVTSNDAANMNVPGGNVKLTTLSTEGGRGAGRRGTPRVVWEQRLSAWMSNQLLMYELLEADGKLRPQLIAAAVFPSAQANIVFLLVESQPMDQPSRTNAPCMPRMAASLTTVSYSVTTNCPNGRNSMYPCLVSQVFNYFALAGGLVLDVPASGEGGQVQVSATGDLCFYDFQNKVWIPPNPKAPPPLPRYQHACSPMAYSVGEYGLVCYGGLAADNTLLGDTVFFSMPASEQDGSQDSPVPTTHSATWQQLAMGDHTPGPRFGMDSLIQAWQSQDSSLRTTYFMAGGRTGRTAVDSHLRPWEVWMLWFDKKCKTGNSMVAIWTQAHASPPPSSTTTLMPTPIILGGATLLQTWLPPPPAPGADPLPAAAARQELLGLSLLTCAKSLEPRCSPATNSFRWDLLDPGIPSPCWAEAQPTLVSVEIKGRSPISSNATRFQGFGSLESLYTSTITADVRDEDGVSIISQSVGLTTSVVGDAFPVLTYSLTPVYIPPPYSTVKANVSLVSYGWILARSQVLLSGNTLVKLSMSLPPAKRATFRATPPANMQLNDTTTSANVINEGPSSTPGDARTPALSSTTPLSPTPTINSSQMAGDGVVARAQAVGPEITYEVWVVTPTGQKVQRACIGGTTLIGTLLEDACYGLSAAAGDNVTLHFLTPVLIHDSGGGGGGGARGGSDNSGSRSKTAASSGGTGVRSRSRSTLELDQAVVYQVKASIHGSGSRPPMVGLLNVTGADLGSWTDSLAPATTTTTGSSSSSSREPVLLLDVAPRPPSTSTTKFNVQFVVTFKSTMFHVPLNLPSGQGSGWVLNLIDLASFPDFSEPVCTVTGPYQPSFKVVCSGGEALTEGTYLAQLVDGRDDAAIIWEDQVEVTSARTPILIEAQMSPLEVSVYFTELAAPQGYTYPATTMPVNGVLVSLTTQPSGIPWDTEFTQAGVASFALVSISPFTQALRYTASLALPGLPPELQPPKQPISITKGNNLQVPLPNVLLCGGTSLLTFTDPSGTYPSKPIENVVYAPGTICNWSVRNPGGELTVLLNFSLIAQGDAIGWSLSSNPGHWERLSLATHPLGVYEIKAVNANVTITLASAPTASLWGRGLRISWSVNSTPSTALPTQLILLIVSTASAGGAILAFVLLWHCFYRPLMRSRSAAAAGAIAGPEGVPGHVPEPVRHHVPKRLLRLLPEKTYVGPEVKVVNQADSVVAGGGDVKTIGAAGGQVGSSTCSEVEGPDEVVGARVKGTDGGRVSGDAGSVVVEGRDGEPGGPQNGQAEGGQAVLPGETGDRMIDGDPLQSSPTPPVAVELTPADGQAPALADAPAPATAQQGTDCGAAATADSNGQPPYSNGQPPSSNGQPPNSTAVCITNAAAVTEHDDDTSAECCSICLSEYVAGERLKVLPCAHSFHTPCIDQWLTRDVCCPLCKRDVVELAALSTDPAVSMTAQIILRKRAARRQSLELVGMAGRDRDGGGAARRDAAAAAAAAAAGDGGAGSGGLQIAVITSPPADVSVEGQATAQGIHVDETPGQPYTRGLWRWYQQSRSGLTVVPPDQATLPVQDSSATSERQDLVERLRQGVSGGSSGGLGGPQQGQTTVDMALLEGHTDRFSWQQGFAPEHVLQQPLTVTEDDLRGAGDESGGMDGDRSARASSGGYQSVQSDAGGVIATAEADGTARDEETETVVEGPRASS